MRKGEKERGPRQAHCYCSVPARAPWCLSQFFCGGCPRGPLSVVRSQFCVHGVCSRSTGQEEMVPEVAKCPSPHTHTVTAAAVRCCLSVSSFGLWQLVCRRAARPARQSHQPLPGQAGVCGLKPPCPAGAVQSPGLQASSTPRQAVAPATARGSRRLRPGTAVSRRRRAVPRVGRRAARTSQAVTPASRPLTGQAGVCGSKPTCPVGAVHSPGL